MALFWINFDLELADAPVTLSLHLGTDVVRLWYGRGTPALPSTGWPVCPCRRAPAAPRTSTANPTAAADSVQVVQDAQRWMVVDKLQDLA